MDDDDGRADGDPVEQVDDVLVVHADAMTMTTIMIIMQTRYLQAGVRRLPRSLQMPIWNRF